MGKSIFISNKKSIEFDYVKVDRGSSRGRQNSIYLRKRVKKKGTQKKGTLPFNPKKKKKGTLPFNPTELELVSLIVRREGYG